MLLKVLPVLSLASSSNLVIRKRDAIVKVTKQKDEVMLLKSIFL
jgi:hypothetical protein